jgi:endonuclease/exonuclease/phosphatase (EEP) superfamily protein YafD
VTVVGADVGMMGGSESHEFMYLGHSDVPAIAARFESADFNGTLIGMHLNPPIGSTWAEDRNIQMEELKNYLLQLDEPFVAVGDFNNTPWSPTFRLFLAETEWSVARPLLSATWPAKADRFGIPIDFAVASGDAALGNRTTVTLPGSDHFGIRIDVGNQQ